MHVMAAAELFDNLTAALAGNATESLVRGMVVDESNPDVEMAQGYSNMLAACTLRPQVHSLSKGEMIEKWRRESCKIFCIQFQRVLNLLGENMSLLNQMAAGPTNQSCSFPQLNLASKLFICLISLARACYDQPTKAVHSHSYP